MNAMRSRRLIALVLTMTAAATIWGGGAVIARADLIAEPQPKPPVEARSTFKAHGLPAASLTVPLLAGGALGVAVFSAHSLFALSRSAKQTRPESDGADASSEVADGESSDGERQAD